MEINLLETDIAQGSYNFKHDPKRTEESKKLLFREELQLDLKFSQNLSDLENSQNRFPCEKCERKSKYYCPYCRIPLPCTELPKVKLPFKLDIIKHVQELDTKSTAVHAKVIAQSDTEIYDFPKMDLKNYSDLNEQVYLVFPDHGKSIENHVIDNLKPVRMVFIDATWKQAKQIVRHENIRNLPRISLQSVKTSYWRYQTKRNDDCLATIEAIYYLTKEFHTKILNLSYNGEYDDLLFLFVHFYSKIHALHGAKISSD